MIDLWSNKAALRSVADEARAAARSGESRWLRGSPGSGRHVAFARLAEDPAVVAIELLGIDQLDASLHALVQLARALDEPVATLSLLDASDDEQVLQDLHDQGRRLGALAHARGKALAVLLPIDWPGDAYRDRVHEDLPTAGLRADAVLRGLHRSGIATIVVSTRAAAHPWRTIASLVELPAPAIGGSAIRPDEVPTIANAAADVAKRLADTGTTASPIEARMLVGLSALGKRIDDLMRGDYAVAPRLISAILERPRLAFAARRLAMSRWGLRRDRLSTVIELDDLDREILFNCVGYGDHVVRISAPMQRELRARTPRAPDGDATHHIALADYHRTLDGVSSPATSTQATTIEWLEKVHHLAHGGAATEDEWAAQAKLGREHYWERARHVSHVEHRYADAAALYRRCLDEFGRDAYTHHYLAFNLDRAQQPIAEVRSNYTTAVELDRTNPWWNARLITFLIAHASLTEAHEAWKRARTAIDPNGDRIEQAPWIALHLHRWVIRQWLALGRVPEARAVLDEIPPRWIESVWQLRELDQLVRDAEEAQALGESVYPTSIPVGERWQRPRATAAINGDGGARTRWWPGYVLAHDGGEVSVVLADPETRTAHRVAYDGDAWRAMSGQDPSDAHGFIELAEYGDRRKQIGFVSSADTEPLAPELEALARRAFAWPAE